MCCLFSLVVGRSWRVLLLFSSVDGIVVVVVLVVLVWLLVLISRVGVVCSG